MSVTSPSAGDKAPHTWGQAVYNALGDGVPVQAANYIIFLDGSTIKARNGTTGKIDYSGTNATTVIQAAHDALTTGGRIHIKHGEYSIPSTLAISNAYIELTGEGPGATTGTVLKLADSADCNMINLDVATFFHLINLKLDGNGSNNASGIGVCADSVKGGDSTGDITIDRCFVAAFKEEDVYWTDCWGSVISNSYIEGSYGNYGMYCATWHNLFVSTTFNYHAKTAVRLAGDDKASMVNCMIVDNGYHGVEVTSGEKIIMGCLISGNGTDTADTYDGIVLSSGDNHAIVGNIIDAKTIKVTPVGTAKTRYGINVSAGVEAVIVANTIENCLTASMNLADTTPTVHYNVGYVTENSGITGAIATGATVTHGLAGTPTSVTVTAAESGPTDIYLSGVGAANFAINFGGGGNKTFYWDAKV